MKSLYTDAPASFFLTDRYAIPMPDSVTEAEGAMVEPLALSSSGSSA